MKDRLVLWLGGMSGVGKTTAARMLARRFDLHLYSLDSRTYAHAEAMNSAALGMTPDQLWVDRTPEQMATDFEAEARARFALVCEDLAAFPDDGAPILAEGPQLLPELVRAPALFVTAAGGLQRQLLAARGSFTYARTSDSDRAYANRARRDELLAGRVRQQARARRFDVLEIEDVRETEPAVERAFEPALRNWLANADHGDVASRRRGENDRRVDQWQRYAAHEPRAAEGKVELACECDRPGCTEVVEVVPGDVEEARLVGRSLLAEHGQ